MYEHFKRCLELEKDYIHVENDGSYFLERKGDKLYIYLEWSNGARDWHNNFDFMPRLRFGLKGLLALPKKSYKFMETTWRCHGGFLKVWKSIEPYIRNDILDPDINYICVIGYSHGAGVAQICFEYCNYWRPDISVTGYGFGAPRAIFGPCGASVERRLRGFLIVRNGRDIVTHLPPKIFGFRDICSVLTIGDKGNPIDDHRPESYDKALKEYEDILDKLICRDVHLSKDELLIIAGQEAEQEKIAE